MIGRFLVIRPVPPALFDDKEALYDALRPIWNEELQNKAGIPLVGPLHYKRLEFVSPELASFVPYVPIAIHGPAETMAP
jgi:hypothetical protein